MSEANQIKVGTRLVVEPCQSFSRKPVPAVEVVVTKAARVWLEMTKEGEEPNFGNTWRMRRDTQDSGDRRYSQHNSHFFTPEQFAKRQQVQACGKILREAGLEFSNRSPLRNDEQFRIDLAGWLEARRLRLAAIAEIQAELA
jgi:hypothetical protein